MAPAPARLESRCLGGAPWSGLFRLVHKIKVTKRSRGEEDLSRNRNARHSSRLLLSTGLLGLSLACHGGALAQTAGSAGPALGATAAAAGAEPRNTPATAHSTNQLQEIVVTAEKRETTVQRTAATVEVLGNAQLQRQRVVELSDLNSVLLDTQVLSVLAATQVTIRGIGSNFVDPRADPAVATSVNGLFFDRPLPVGFGFLDVSRVENLEGPQGTLYGRNAAAGALNIITNQPTHTFGGMVQATGGNLGENEFTGVLNVPVTDQLAVRLAYDRDRRDGYIGGYYGDKHNDVGRISVRWTPTPQLTVYGEADYLSVGGHGDATTSYPCAPSQAWTLYDPASCALPGLRSGAIPTNGREGSFVNADQVHVDYNFGWATLTSISGFVGTHDRNLHTPNGSYFEENILSNSFDYSEEIRLAGHDSASHKGGFAWQTGVYLFDSTGNFTNQVFGPSFLPPTGITTYSKLPQSSEAGYAQATYGITDQLRLTGGLRYTHDFKSNSAEATNFLGTTVGKEGESNSKVTYKVGLEYDLAPGKLLYGTVSSGYVAGGANGGNARVPLAANVTPALFQPETITAYEVGSKNRFLDNRLQLNGSFYYYDFSNYQYLYQALVQGGGTVLSLVIQNAPSATAYGVELSAEYALTPDDRLSASFSATHATFGTLNFATYLPPFGPAYTIHVPSGSALPNDPDESALVGYEHTWRLGRDFITASANTHVASKALIVVGSADPYDFQKAYAMTDASVAYHFGDKYVIRAFAKNLENVPVNVYGQGPQNHLYTIEPPRTYGVTVTANF